MKLSFRLLTNVFNNRWSQVFLGFIIFIGLGTVYAYGILRVEIERTLSVNSTLSGLPYLTSLFFYALSMFLSGKYLYKYDPKKLMVIGSSLVSVGWILSALATNIFSLTISYGFILGTGVGIVYGVPIIVIPKWFTKRKGLAVGLILAGFGLSPLVTAPLTQRSLDQIGLSKTFLTFGIIFGILLPLLASLFQVPKESNTQDLNRLKKPLAKIIRTKSFWILYLNFLIGTSFGLMIIGTSGIIGSNYFDIDIHVVAYMISFFALCNALGRPLFGFLNDHIKTTKTIVIIHIITISSSLIFITQPFNAQTNYVLGSFSLWMTLGAWLAVAPSATRSLFGEHSFSKNYGVVFTGYGLGAIIGVIYSSVIIDQNLSLSYVFFPMILFSFIALVLTILCINPKN